ncbi:MAG: 50S ribosomal protein L21 [Candidatus Gottesmanbacteria bacterium]|nr:50S ribosomal protein L21 [Candidatus Gottesmanbacteria bacterium]
MFAVVRIGPTQYKVSVGDSIEAANMVGEVGDIVTLSEVLLIDDNGKTTLGTPTVKGASVKATIDAHHKGEKIHVRRFKSKVRERRHIGFRAQLTRLQITAIHA